MHPNNQITILRLRRVGITRDTVHLIAEALQSPENKLEVLDLAGCNEGLQLVSRALRSEHCKLRKLVMEWPSWRTGGMRMDNPYCSDDVVADIFRSMLIAPSCPLEEVSVESWDCPTMSGVCRLAKQLMEKPGNRLKGFSVRESDLSRKDILCLLSGAQVETNVLDNLDVSCNNVASWVLPDLIKTITGPNCKLRRLLLTGTYLTFTDCSTIVHALQTSSSSRLEDLQLGTLAHTDHPNEEPELWMLLSGTATFLKSQNCRLKMLQLDLGAKSDFRSAALARDLLPTARTSSLQRLWFTPSQPGMLHWTRAFHSSWFRVLVTLLSVRLVPRLCCRAACGLVPFNNLLPHIVETLRWPVHSLTRLKIDDIYEDDDEDYLDFDFDDDDEFEQEEEEKEPEEEDALCVCQ